MKRQKEFYIGWKEEMPESNRTFLKRILIPIFILIPLLVLTVVVLEKPFNKHQFEFGKITTITGIYYDSPVPILIADKGVLPDSLSHEIMLVGYGKFGARGIIRDIEKSNGVLKGKKISLAGTLIYGDGKTLLELTEQQASLIKVVDKNSINPPAIPAPKVISLSGEIIDPKCYFGVMKPGEGKVHKSCAIRCISGGIPPVFKTKIDGHQSKYYLLLDEQGAEINKEVLPFVAEQINLTGNTNRFLNWDILYVNIENFNLLK